jgi:hypothetical protein
MISSSPITPPPELVKQWLDNDHFPMVTGTNDLLSITRDRLRSVMAQAAQWGADQELEACCEWLRGEYDWGLAAALRLDAERRPEPPSLKEQALELAKPAGTDGAYVTFGPEELTLIRRALEALND